MSRKIKFRVWNNNTNRYNCTELNYYFVIDQRINAYEYEQFTGLKDKNGKMIYEGDIVKGEMGVFEVRWYDAIASFCFKPNTEMKWHPNFNQGTTYYMEIVGNVHENPELLEGKK